MIYDRLDKAELYFRQDSPMRRALSFVLAFNPREQDGRYEIDGEDIFALVSSYETSPAGERRFEAHGKYADVQVVFEGEERIDVSLSPDLKIIENYCETGDVAFFEAPRHFASLVMVPGYFAVFYPHDVHRPNCDLRSKTPARKIVVKVRVS